MKRIFRYFALLVTVVFSACATHGGAPAPAPAAHSAKGVMIVKPETLSTVRSPVEVCMSASGYTVEPAKTGVTEGHGHHHILVDVFPSQVDFSKPLPKDANHIHMGDGSSCKTLTLSPGLHTISAQFARGNHVPYEGVHDTISIKVSGTYGD